MNFNDMWIKLKNKQCDYEEIISQTYVWVEKPVAKNKLSNTNVIKGNFFKRSRS